MIKRSKSSIFFSLIILFILIVLFPLISVKYLNKGLDFRKEHLSTLSSLGELADFNATNRDGKTLSPANYQGKVILISDELISCDITHALTLEEYVGKFDNQDVFRHVILQSDASCDSWEESYLASKSENLAVAKQFDQLVAEGNRDSDVILVDREGQIRRVYDLTKTEDIEALVTHTTILLPPLKKRK